MHVVANGKPITMKNAPRRPFANIKNVLKYFVIYTKEAAGLINFLALEPCLFKMQVRIRLKYVAICANM